MDTLLLYTEQSSRRLVYTFDLLLRELLGLDYRLTHNPDEFKAHSGPKFSYATQRVHDELFFEHVPLLFETDIRHQVIGFLEWENLVGFFPVYKDSALPFDMFATAFFMLSRYEEYLPSSKDKYDRYRASQSLNQKAGVLEKPIVNYYAEALKKMLHARFPHLVFKQSRFRYRATFDVDIAYSYRGKGWKRTLGGIGRSLLFSRFAEVKDRLLVLTHRRKDPYDTYDYLLQVCRDRQIETLFFFLLGDESKFDKNTDHKQKVYQNLMQDIRKQSELGIHLSYRSHVASKVMQREIDRLKNAVQEEVFRNRFHYLRFQLPDDYERLVKLDIREDYSMGYAPHVGFRAGICTPFTFFNLKTNAATSLRVFPIAFMDTTFVHYYRADNDFTQDKILQLMKSVAEVQGDFMGLWHNSSFTETGEWKGWRELFETTAQQASLLQNEP